MKAYEAGTEFSNSFRKTFTKNNNHQHNQTNPSGSTGNNNTTTMKQTINTTKTKHIDRISGEDWEKEIIREILDAPTIRQSVQEVGYGLSEIIDCLIDESDVSEERPNFYTFIKDNIKDHEGYVSASSNDQSCAFAISLASSNKKHLCIWKAVDEVMELYSCQLSMTDEEVESAVYDPKILSGLMGSNHHCHHSAFIAIFKSLHDYLFDWIRASEHDCE
jgi:macrodomain Ter protein organizer (MatP/YcbG family)